MPNCKFIHNANLLSTLPQKQAVVNYVDIACDGSRSYSVVNAPSKLFVQVPNSIFTYRLEPRVLEFYCLLSYLMYSMPDTKLSIVTIMDRIMFYTSITMSKNTVNKYLNLLIDKGVISCVNSFYSNTSVCSGDKNSYRVPKGNYTNFFITQYYHGAKLGTAGLEFYMASKIYSHHVPSLVCKELDICSKTYYSYLNNLLINGYLVKIVIDYRKNYYKAKFRTILWEDYIAIKDYRFWNQKEKWSELRKAKLLARKAVRESRGEIVNDFTVLNCANSRLWFASPMKRIMKEYKIRYIHAFDNIDPDDAYIITQELIEQYRCSGLVINAAIIVRGILNNYNWVKIQDRIHAKRKRELRNEEIRLSYGENYVDYMMGY
jgi:hypothetical protein